MKRILFFYFLLLSIISFGQQNEYFKEVKQLYDDYQLKIDHEFKHQYALIKIPEEKVKLEAEYRYLIYQLNKVRNYVYLGVLIRTKNQEQLSLIKKSISEIKELAIDKQNDQQAEFPGGMERLKKIIEESFYFNAFVDPQTTLKSITTFVVEKDGSISHVESEGENAIFNRQTEICLYLLPEKFIPAQSQGKAVRSLFKLPITMKFE
ncbi:hypothetical protein GNY06_04365 [Elizabethkingia argentiflava]|uniref:TonB C-terminal domain-containing protein n=1 Tax=Elizabethkingia argenteiflava TaxID=2681556 RepID=A0A845PR29_9FLAO|nr:hypothetical protein [Elizabethkingia argenteiflava]NAW50652.1 hypothetical protein [Elizabethkingia argenteiflava]